MRLFRCQRRLNYSHAADTTEPLSGQSLISQHDETVPNRMSMVRLRWFWHTYRERNDAPGQSSAVITVMRVG